MSAVSWYFSFYIIIYNYWRSIAISNSDRILILLIVIVYKKVAFSTNFIYPPEKPRLINRYMFLIFILKGPLCINCIFIWDKFLIVSINNLFVYFWYFLFTPFTSVCVCPFFMIRGFFFVLREGMQNKSFKIKKNKYGVITRKWWFILYVNQMLLRFLIYKLKINLYFLNLIQLKLNNYSQREKILLKII